MIEPKPLIVIVHEDERILAALEAHLEPKEYLLVTFISKERSLSFIGRNGPDLVLVQRAAVPSDGIAYLEQIKSVSSCTEGIFLPSPLELGEDGSLNPSQSCGITQIVERLLTVRVIPEFRRTETRSFRVRPVEA